jgi:hypothetical protein
MFAPPADTVYIGRDNAEAYFFLQMMLADMTTGKAMVTKSATRRKMPGLASSGGLLGG